MHLKRSFGKRFYECQRSLFNNLIMRPCFHVAWMKQHVEKIRVTKRTNLNCTHCNFRELMHETTLKSVKQRLMQNNWHLFIRSSHNFCYIIDFMCFHYYEVRPTLRCKQAYFCNISSRTLRLALLDVVSFCLSDEYQYRYQNKWHGKVHMTFFENGFCNISHCALR